MPVPQLISHNFSKLLDTLVIGLAFLYIHASQMDKIAKTISIYETSIVQKYLISCLYRWEVCAEFINQHSSNTKTAKEVLAKAKEMQSGNFAMSSLKEEVNKLAYENLQKGNFFNDSLDTLCSMID